MATARVSVAKKNKRGAVVFFRACSFSSFASRERKRSRALTADAPGRPPRLPRTPCRTPAQLPRREAGSSPPASRGETRRTEGERYGRTESVILRARPDRRPTRRTSDDSRHAVMIRQRSPEYETTAYLPPRGFAFPAVLVAGVVELGVPHRGRRRASLDVTDAAEEKSRLQPNACRSNI